MTRNKTLNLTITAIFLGILLLQDLVPNIGNIQILPGLPQVTTIPLTVAVYATLMGPKAGCGFGLVWGILSLINAYTRPSSLVSLLLFQNPVIALLPRLAAGWISGWVGQRVSKKFYWLTGVSASLVNTLLVIITTSLFFTGNPKLLQALGYSDSNLPLIWILLVALGFNCILESIFSGLVSGLVLPPLTIRVKEKLKD
ncbi:ECF transporter S component [Lactobacillus corticis]|uniref:Membrane protein n=1 Tax=Lactobacillus corticis TaxID=2201249 RepID=A0A916QIQ8_9LACO|nr:ECF transporter S component [Lactobacillus corticis]GFZ26337.1 membrane protein [Lactobacillus corticis]